MSHLNRECGRGFKFRVDTNYLHGFQFAARLMRQQLICVQKELSNIIAPIRIRKAKAQY